MYEFLIYAILTTAVMASVYIGNRLKEKGKDSSDLESRETDDGKFAIPKPADEDMEGIVCQEIRTNPKFKNSTSQLNTNTHVNNNDLGGSPSDRNPGSGLAG
jgi:hypothetical protein